MATDQELMRRLADGDEDVLGPLYGRYVRLVLSVAGQSLDQSAAEDQPIYAPAPVARQPRCSGARRTPAQRGTIVDALRRAGRAVTVVLLDHDPEVSRIMPNLVAVVVTP